ncbi:hypothetical protein ACEPAI_1908 [Sanghuangporus weigelae]
METTIVCLLVDRKKKTVLGSPFSVVVGPDANIEDLTKKIKEGRPNALGNVDAADLSVWRCMDPKLLAGVTLTQLEKDLSEVDFTDETKTVKLGLQKITTLSLSDEILLIEAPSKKDAELSDEPTGRDPTLRARVTFFVGLLASEEVDWPHVFRLNGYRTSELLEDYMVDIVRVPRHPGSAEMCDCLTILINKSIEPQSYRTRINEMINHNANTAIPYSDGNHEVFHFIQAISTVYRSESTGDDLSNEAAWLLLFEKFKVFWTEQVKGTCDKNQSFPFPLIAHSKGLVHDDRQFTYRPRPDFALFMNGFPSFLAEFDSKSNRKDLVRLQVQLACSVRLGIQIRGETSSEDNKFFLMGAFFSTQWEITRLFCYSKKNGDVHFSSETYKITDALQLTTFLFEFYNYVRHVQNGCNVGKEGATVESMKKAIDQEHLDTLTGKKNGRNDDGNRDPKRRRTGKNQNQDQNHEQIMDALEKANFKVQSVKQSVKHGPDLEPMHKLPSHVLEATSSEGVPVVAKLVHSEDSDELSLLEELNAQRSPHNHVIPLMETLELGLGGFLIILPKKTSISNLSPCVLDCEFVRLSHQLVEGVAFLHRHKIAHLDIKPDNLVWDGESRCLYIIDFDIAVRCMEIDEMIELSCGTPNWSAPEIVHGDKRPSRAFNPIRADLWSCGAVLRFFGRGKDRAIDSLTGLLLNHDPRRRPLLHKLVDEEPDFWPSGRLLHALALVGNLKRRRSNSGGSPPKRPQLDDSNTMHASDSDFSPAMPGHFSGSSTQSSASGPPSPSPEQFSPGSSTNSRVRDVIIWDPATKSDPPLNNGKAGFVDEGMV